MIGYCPLEELEPPVKRQEQDVKPKTEAANSLALEETECNYVIMAFIVGVLVLAVSDSIRA